MIDGSSQEESSPRRAYRSTLRREAAARTRRQILDAARSLFVADGYARTTIEGISQTAGVSRPTVFASVGNKAEILKVLRDLALAGDDAPVPVLARPWYREALDEADPVRSIELHARNMARIYSRYAGIDKVIHQAAGADEELAELAATSESQRRMGASAFIRALKSKTALRDGLDEERAVDTLWALASSDGYRRLVTERGWTDSEYQDWLARSLVACLLGTPRRAPSRTGTP